MANKYIRHGATVDGDGLTSGLAVTATVTFDTGTDTVTWTGHTFSNGDRVYFSGGTLPTGLTANVAYFVRDQATNTFKVAATSGGAAIDLSGTPSGTTSGFSSGAWNTINYVFGTAPTRGSVAASDTIYIRSKDESGNNLSRASGSSSNVGSTAATSVASAITWVLDNGNVWSGVQGTLTINHTTWEVCTIRAYNRVISEAADGIILLNASTSRSSQLLVGERHIYTKNIKVDASASTASADSASTVEGRGTHENLHVIANNCAVGSCTFSASASMYQTDNVLRLVNPTIELNKAGYTGGSSVFQALAGDAGGASIEVIGGKVIGVAAGEGSWSLVRQNSLAGRVRTFGLSYPKAMPTLSTVALSVYQADGFLVQILGVDYGYGSFFGNRASGYFDSRNLTYNYPTLNAMVPDSSSTPWSWRGVPLSMTSETAPLSLTMAKLYTDNAAAKTVTVQFLISDTVATAKMDRNYVWMTVSYVRDSDNTYVTETTRLDYPGTALTTPGSEIVWEPSMTWGVVSCVKRALSLTTSAAIKKDSMVIVQFVWSVATANANDMIFVCPDTVLS